MPRKQVQLAEVINTGVEALKHSMYHCLPGIVHSFTPGVAGQSPATADVQVAIRDPRWDIDSGGRLDFDANGNVQGTWGPFPDQPQFKKAKNAQGQTVLQGNNMTLPSERYHDEPWPIMAALPILYPRGGGYCFQFPLAQGDHVVVLFFDLDPTAHRVYGDERNPIDVGRHRGGYACCIPADICDPSALQDSAAAGNMLVIGKDGAAQQIRIDGNHINLGNATTDAVALATKIDSLINLLVATYTPSGTETGFASLLTALQSWKTSNWTTSTTVGSSLIKGQ